MLDRAKDRIPGNWAESADAVIDAETDDFRFLIKTSGLDPKKHLRFADWSGVDFSGDDLRGFDFTGARLHGCNFKDAQIASARFDQAEIDRAGLDSARRTRLNDAKDWGAYVESWRKPETLLADKHLPAGAVFQDAPFAPEMVVIPPGEFMMGSPRNEPERRNNEGPQHRVTIEKSFAAGRFAVTFDDWDFAQTDKDWRKITGLKPRKPKDQGWGRGNQPVINVSWEDAQAYAKWLQAKTGRDYRLLSEAQWEYCCRAGTHTPFWWGPSITPEQANYDGDYVYEGGGEKGEYRQKTVPVDQFAPNPFGLHQFHGNVWEWVEDHWNEHYDGAPDDGSAWTTGDDDLRVLRGGSWVNNPQNLRAANRLWYTPVNRYNNVGFRLSRTLNP